MLAFKYLFIFSPNSFPTCYSQSIYLVTDAVEIATLNFSTTPQRCNTNWRLLCTNSDRLFLVSWVTMEWFEHAKRKLVAQTSGVLRQYLSDEAENFVNTFCRERWKDKDIGYWKTETENRC